MPALTSGEIASRVQGRLVGPDDIEITGVAALNEAGPSDVSFLGNPRYRDQVIPSAAAVVLVPEAFEQPPPEGRAWIECEDPSAAFSRLVAAFAPPPVSYPPGIDPSAVVAEAADLDASVHVGPCAVIEAGVRLGAGSVVAAGCVIGRDTVIGEECLLYPNVTIRERTRIGDRVIIHSGTTVGSDGFGYVPGEDGHTKIPQVGIVQIDDDVEIGAQAAVDRARFGRTWIRRGAKIDNLVQVAHNVVIGEHCFVIAQVGIAGSTRLGRGVIAAGQVGLAGHLQIGDGATLMAQSGISKDVPAGARVMGSPAVPYREFVKSKLAVHQVPKLKEKLRRLEAEVEELRQTLETLT